MTFSGNVNVLDAAGAVSKLALRDEYLIPTASDIEALQDGSGIAMAGTVWDPLLLNTTARLLVAQDGVTKPVTATALYRALKDLRPWISADDIGMVGDGVTDDAPALQRAYDQYAALGGAVFMLKAQAGQSFFLGGTVRGGSNCSTVFFSPHTVSRSSRMVLGGSLATVSGVTGIQLASSAAADGDTLLLDLAPIGAGVVSSVLAVGDSIRITGLRDSCGTSLQSQDLRITALDDDAGSVTVTPALAYAYETAYELGDFETAQGATNRTLISKLLVAKFDADTAAHTNLVTIATADVANLTEGDWVLAIADNDCADIAGTSTNLTHVQVTRIAPSVSGDSAGTVRLTQRLERAYTTAQNARLIKINPIVNASIQGATVEFTDTPEEDVYVHCFEVLYGVDCVLSGCNVPNTDTYGTRGAAFRLHRSHSSGMENCTARRARYFAGGEGYGMMFNYSSNCWSRGGVLDSMRHGVVFQGSTNCVATDPIIDFSRQAPVDFHGSHEYGCRVVNPICTGSTSHETIGSVSPVGIAFGNTTHLAGSHKCGVEGGRFSGYKGAEGTHKGLIEFRVPSTDCYVRDTEFHDIGILFVFADLTDYGALISSGHRITGVSVDGCAGYLMYLNGQENGAVINTLQDIAISDCTFRNINKTIYARFITELQMYENEADEITVDGGFTYFVDAADCPNFVFSSNHLNGAGRMLKLDTCTDFRVYDNVSDNQTFATVYRDEGGNTGVWNNNRSPGQTPASTRNGSIITEGPRAAGVVVMADDTAFGFRPERLQGVVQIWSSGSSTHYGMARYIVVGSVDCDLVGSVSTADIAVTTGVLAGTTGTDGKLTISAANTGVIYFENRMGGEVTIDFSTF
jgi:hypothetical protein